MVLNQSDLKCSVALCTYNGEKYLAELLDSILSQSVSASELVVVDDCSTDGTVLLLQEYAARFPQLKLTVLEENLGPVGAFQLAIQSTTYPFIFLADQDDIWKSNKIESMLIAASDCPKDKPVLAYSDLEVIDEKSAEQNPSFWKMAGLEPHQATFRSLMFGNVVTGCATMINAKMKQLLSSIPSGVLMHDHWIGLIGYGFGEVILIDEPLVKYRVHADSVTEKKQSSLLWKIRVQLDQIFDRSSDFLKKEINQIVLFDQQFGRFLSPEKQKYVERFVALKHQSLVKRKLVSYLRQTI